MPGRLLDLGSDLRTTGGEIRHAGKAGPQHETIAAAAETIEPSRSLARRQPIENGNRCGNIGFERAEHDCLRRHVAFEKQDAERKAIGDRETEEKNEKKPSA